MARLRRTFEAFEEWLAGHPKVDAGLRRVADELRDEVERQIVAQAYDTGRLSRAVVVERHRSGIARRSRYVVRSYAGKGEPDALPKWITGGTGIYGPRRRPITPKTARYLRFKPKGSTTYVYARSVRGMKPRPYMDDAARVVGARPGLRYKSHR